MVLKLLNKSDLLILDVIIHGFEFKIKIIAYIEPKSLTNGFIYAIILFRKEGVKNEKHIHCSATAIRQ